MSEYIRAQTKIKAEHLDCLAKALADLQPTWAEKMKIEMHEQGARLSWHGEVARAVIVRAPGAPDGIWYDIGFEAQPDGSVQAIIEDGVQSRLGKTWLDRLTQHYAFRVVEKQAARMGLSATKTKEHKDGSWRVELVKRPVAVGRVW